MGFWPALFLGVVAGLGVAAVIITLFRDENEKHSSRNRSGTSPPRYRNPSMYQYHLDDDDRTCVVCLDYDANIFFEPCGHFCCCAECASKLQDCPLCRRQINAKTAPDATYKTLCKRDVSDTSY